jgi:hypothetical protein
MSAVLVRGDEVSSVTWPATPGGDYARRWLVPFVADGPARYISNVNCQVGALLGGTWAVPVTITDGAERDNAYVVSPFTHYVSYLGEELRLVHPGFLRRVLSGVVNGLGGVLRGGQIDRVATVNNWMVSTNLYPTLTPDDLAEMTGTMVGAYPGHAIMFRSLNAKTTGPIMQTLAGLGYMPVVSRQVYIFDACRDDLFKRKAFRRDWAAITEQGYTVVPVTAVDDSGARRFVDLYEALYLTKYSRHNPAFSADFIERAVRDGLLTLYALEKDGRVDGVLGFFERNGVMTTPLLGYDTALPLELGLYRMLTALLSTLARERRAILHRSSGAATFKLSRGAERTLEYSMVYVRHLPRSRRAPWHVLRVLTNYVGKPLITRYDR